MPLGGYSGMLPERRLGTAVLLLSVALLIIHVTTIILILSDVEPIRLGPDAFVPATVIPSTPLPHTPPPNPGSSNGTPSHGHCDFGHSDEWVDTLEPTTPAPGVTSPPIVSNGTSDTSTPGTDGTSSGTPVSTTSPTTPPNPADSGATPSTSPSVPGDEEPGPDVDYNEPPISTDQPLVDDMPTPDDTEPETGGIIISVADDPPTKPPTGGKIINVPFEDKSPPPAPPMFLSKQPALFHVWNETQSAYKTYTSSSGNVYDKMVTDGIFGDTGTNIIFLIHGWHGVSNGDNYFKAMLRFHTRMTPDATIIYLNWDAQGANRSIANATLYSWRVNVSSFLEGAKNATHNWHCIGHSIGAFACSAICRQYHAATGRLCDRIVAIDPYDVLLLAPDLTSRVRARTIRRDAQYVAIFATSKQAISQTDSEADEYITTTSMAETSEICANTEDWEVNVCGTSFGGSRICEYLGVHNISRPDPKENGTMLCSRMIAPAQFLRTLDTYAALPLIRINPMATSPIIGMLPSVWNAYSIGRDYRFSTYIRNDSVWYSFMMVQNNTGVDPVYVFTIVIPSVNNARIAGALYTAKTMYHNISVYSAFLKGSEMSGLVDSITVSTDGPIISAYMWGGRAFNGTSTTQAMPSQVMTPYKCDMEPGNHTCKADSTQASPTYVAAYRPQFIAKSISLLVPPIEYCLPYYPPAVDIVVWRRRDITLKSNSVLTVDYSHSRQLMAIVLENHDIPSNTTLMTFYDACDVSSLVGVNFVYDWLNAKMNITIGTTGRYTIRWFFLYETLEVPVIVT